MNLTLPTARAHAGFVNVAPSHLSLFQSLFRLSFSRLSAGPPLPFAFPQSSLCIHVIVVPPPPPPPPPTQSSSSPMPTCGLSVLAFQRRSKDDGCMDGIMRRERGSDGSVVFWGHLDHSEMVLRYSSSLYFLCRQKKFVWSLGKRQGLSAACRIG